MLAVLVYRWLLSVMMVYSYKSCGLDAVSKGQVWKRDGRGMAIISNWSTHYSISLQRDVLHIDCGVRVMEVLAHNSK